ncbi:MAG: ThuA domain-containing protein, partial [Planctomycetota bacterium]
LAAPQAHAADKLKVLLIDGQNNHNWQLTTPIMKKLMEDSGRFEVTVSTTPPSPPKVKRGQKPTPQIIAAQQAAIAQAKREWPLWNPDFKAYDVVVSNYNGEPWPEKVMKSFERYVENGGGFVAVHAADNAFPEWLEYNKMIAVGGWGGRTEKHGPYIRMKDGKMSLDYSVGKGGSHGPQHEYILTHHNDHPITKGLPRQWKHTKDELYDSLRGPAQNVTVIATSWSEKTGLDEPSLMVIRYGKGRVFHTTLGHTDYSLQCVGFATTLNRGAEWVATGKVTIPAPKNFPSADMTSPIK